MSERLDECLEQAWEVLTGPGAPFELKRIDAHGRDVLAYVNAPAHLGALWESSAQWGDRDYIVFKEERLTYRDAHRDDGDPRLAGGAGHRQR